MYTLSGWGAAAPQTPGDVRGGASPPQESAFGLHAPYAKASGDAILLLSAKDTICQTGSDILTSCPTCDESACPRYDESDQVFKKTNRPDGRTVGRSDSRTVGQSVGRLDETVGRSVSR